MLEVFDQSRLSSAGAYELSDALEHGAIVHFPQSPVAIPDESDLDFFRQELPKLLKLKNISYHPEAGHVRGLDVVDPAIATRVTKVLRTVSDDIGLLSRATCPEPY